MAAAAISNAYDAVHNAIDTVSSTVGDNKAAVAAGGLALLGLYGASKMLSPNRDRPGSLDLTGGNIAKNDVKSKFEDYAASYSKGGAVDQKIIKDKSKTQELVSTFYNLVTDIYEWGWGTSFHFSPLLPGKTVAASEAAHEARIGALLGLGPGKKALDAGCGVGGPMRTIASCTGASIVGLTINDYQVERATHHNKRLGLQQLCTVVQGDYLAIPFPQASFDGAFSIESTCHAPKLEQVYAEIFKVLKPGARYVSYEWVTTKLFDPNNPEHVAIIDEINWGNGLPDMRTYKQAEEAGKKAGFKLVIATDLAVASQGALPWYNRLRLNRFLFRYFNGAIINTLCMLGLAPKGFNKVHDMLLDTVDALLQGGQKGIFTPMYMMVFEKPAA